MRVRGAVKRKQRRVMQTIVPRCFVDGIHDSDPYILFYTLVLPRSQNCEHVARDTAKLFQKGHDFIAIALPIWKTANRVKYLIARPGWQAVGKPLERFFDKTVPALHIW